jgi:transposase-like protein
MTQAKTPDPIYRGRRFKSDTIELCVRWYITYRLSYRDLVAMMAEHGIAVSHTTIMRWVMRYVPEFERRWSRYASRLHSSWRMDETAVPVRGGRHYLYRAVDKYGRSVDSLLCADRGIGAAQAFFRKAVDANYQRWPRKVNVDGHMATHVALHLLRDAGAQAVGRDGRRAAKKMGASGQAPHAYAIYSLHASACRRLSQGWSLRNERTQLLLRTEFRLRSCNGGA